MVAFVTIGKEICGFVAGGIWAGLSVYGLHMLCWVIGDYFETTATHLLYKKKFLLKINFFIF